MLHRHEWWKYYSGTEIDTIIPGGFKLYRELRTYDYFLVEVA